MRDIDFGSSTYKAPPNPADYPFVYLMANERHTVEKLGKLSLPFEPYMVNSGCVYAISSPILTEPLVQIASIVLSVNDRKVLHCDKAFWSTIDKVPVTVCYDAVFDLLRRNGIYHVPPSFEMSVAMLDAMRAEERNLIKCLSTLGVLRNETPINHQTPAGVWDNAINVRASIRSLKAQLTQTQNTSDSAKAVMVTKMMTEVGVQFFYEPDCQNGGTLMLD